MDDGEARGFLFGYDKLLGAKAPQPPTSRTPSRARTPLSIERGAYLQEPRADLMRSPPLDLLQEWEVTPRMNSNRYHEADAIEPLTA